LKCKVQKGNLRRIFLGMMVIQRINVKRKLKKWKLLKTNGFEIIESIIYLNKQKITYG